MVLSEGTPPPLFFNLNHHETMEFGFTADHEINIQSSGFSPFSYNVDRISIRYLISILLNGRSLEVPGLASNTLHTPYK